jgi:hypothetical protein
MAVNKGLQGGVRYLVLGRGDMVEARSDAALEDANAVGEVGKEEGRLVALHLPVLDGHVLQVRVQLDGLVHSGTGLVL